MLTTEQTILFDRVGIYPLIELPYKAGAQL